MSNLQPDDIVIVSAKRTPIGSFSGVLSQISATELGAVAIKSAVERAGLQPEQINEVLMGNVLSAGLGQAPARQATLKAGLPQSTHCTAISKVCGSGMKAVMLAHDQIKADNNLICIAGGMENMSLAPYLLPKARTGYRLGHRQTLDHMFFDGLQDAYCGDLMGVFADANSKESGITREQMDQYTLSSLERAQTAIRKGYFDNEICPVCVHEKKSDKDIHTDEQPGRARPEKIMQLKPAFAEDGLITAANASSISDGAAALLLCSFKTAQQHQIKPLAVIRAHASHAGPPERFTHAPIGSIDKALNKADWKISDVDLFEVNEAFAMVAICAIDSLALDREKVNINGGACALGHPIGASGARIIVTLIHALIRLGKQKGVASLCIGGGEATAIALELC